MSLQLLSPIPGTLRNLAELSDPVFAQEIMGPGFAIFPDEVDTLNILAPIDGTLTHQLPHACALTTPDGLSILIHAGIDTVLLKGEGFSPPHQLGQHVHAGSPLITWDLRPARQAGYDLDVVVIAMQPPQTLCELLIAPGSRLDTLVPCAVVRRAPKSS